ncbi:MAG: hypothetical protein DMF12_12555 [Verrucomicrobia bacterium]|nr:MAG: hypothetical protein DMF12_12555 [Verrucomicrobiota bacterium]
MDGHGLFRQGVVSIRSAFQAKRWRQNAVTRPEIDKFRGAIQGDYDHGVFLTTGRFTADAEAASIKKGAISLLQRPRELRIKKAELRIADETHFVADGESEPFVN